MAPANNTQTAAAAQQKNSSSASQAQAKNATVAVQAAPANATSVVQQNTTLAANKTAALAAPANKTSLAAPKNATSLKQSAPANETLVRYEKDFVDLQAEDVEDDENKPGKQEKLQTTEDNEKQSLVQMSEKERMAFGLKKIQKNVELAQKAISKHKKHAKELKELVKSQKGRAKKELAKGLRRAEAHVQELEDYIEEGNHILSENHIEPKEHKEEKKTLAADKDDGKKKQALVESKKSKEHSKKHEAKKDSKHEAKKEKKKESKKESKKEAKHESKHEAKKEAKKEASKKFKKELSETKQEAETQAKKANVNIQALIEKNTKEWEAKYSQAKADYEHKIHAKEDELKK